MAQLLLISAETFKDGVNQIGDIVGIFDDSHVFTPTEHIMFVIGYVPNITRDELISSLKFPELQEVKTEDTSIKMWRNSPNEPWKKLEKEPKYMWTTAGLTEEQKTAFQSSAISKEVKLAMIGQLGNNYSYIPENRAKKLSITVTEEIVE